MQDREREQTPLHRRAFLRGVTAGAAGLALGTAAAESWAREEPAAGAADGLVKRRPLGKTGIQGSVIAFGCAGLGTEHLGLLKVAYERGVNLFDVAWGYRGGQAEVALGQFLQGLPDRAKVHVITKTTGFRQPQGSSAQVHHALREELTKSLKRLQTDYVDVLYCPHGATAAGQVRDEALGEALAKLKEEQLVRHAGASSHTNYAAVGAAAVGGGHCEVFMPVANICTQNAARARALGGGRGIEDTRPVLKEAARRQVGLVAMKAANDGYLTAQTDTLLAEAFPAQTGLSRHQRLYKYMLDQEGVSSVVIGIRSVTHLREAIAIAV